MGSINVQVSHRKKGTYVSVIETFIDPISRKKTSRTIRTIGYVDEELKRNPNYLDELRNEAKKLRQKPEEADEMRTSVEKRIYPISPDEEKTGYEAAPRQKYGDAAIRTVWEELGLPQWFDKVRRNSKLDYDLDLAAFYNVAMRILSPGSRRHMKTTAPQFFFDYDSLKLKHLYAALGEVHKRKAALFNFLQTSINKLVKRDLTLVFYDVTTFYFESFEPDNLRRRGMSKEHRTHETQVVLGLLIDRNGIPLSYELFPGNTAETNTLMQVVEAYRQNQPDGRVIVIADRGLNRRSNLKALRDAGCDYIVAYSLHRLTQKNQEELFNDSGWTTNATPEGEVRWRFKSMPLPSAEELGAQAEPAEAESDDELPSPGEELKRRDVRLIVSWSAARYYNDKKELDAKKAIAEAMIQQGKGKIDASFRRGSRQFLKKEKRTATNYVFNKELFDKKMKFAGYYGLVTSCTDMSDDEVYKRLRELWRIEENFRCMKTLLEARPVFVWTEEHIRGHFALCVVALTIQRIMQMRLRNAGEEMSFEHFIDILHSPAVSPIMGARNKVPLYLKTGTYSNKAPELEEPQLVDLAAEADRVMKVFGIEPLKTLETLTDIRRRLKVRLPLRPEGKLPDKPLLAG